MKFIRRKIAMGLLSAAILINGSISVYASEDNETPPPKVNLSEMAKEISKQYDVNENEVLSALKEERSLDDIYYAAIFAKVSGKSFRQVFAMKSDWFDVMKALGITREKYEEAVLDLMVKDISERSNVSEAEVKKLLDNNYHPRDIRIAGRLAKASGKKIQTVLDMKKINQRWIDVADELKVDKSLVRPRTPVEEEEDAETTDAETTTK